MSKITVTRTWLSTFRSYEQSQEWVHDDRVYCPSCGKLDVWIESSGHHSEDNVGDCYLCLSCKHSFHYSDPGYNYINESETNSIIEALMESQR